MRINSASVIGVLGGMGPYATIHFLNRLLDLTPTSIDSDHFRTITDINVKIPSRTRAVKYGEYSPVNDIICCINNLGDAGCEFVMLPCNSVHYFYKDVAPHIKIPWLNMIEIVSERTVSRNLKKSLILGGFVTTNKKLYSLYNPDSVYLDEYGNKQIEKIIEEIKSYNEISKNSFAILQHLIMEIKSEIDSIILACTELSIVFTSKDFDGIPIVDSSEEYIVYLLEKII
ncbi:MAG: aspartate/glutamate racemase family protein [Mariniphaga sp.]|nr:aspartate/glutamate racemase family protein [Mariniphaga sp.]